MGWTDELTKEVTRLRSDGYSWTQTAQYIKKHFPAELRGFTESQALRKARNVTQRDAIRRPTESKTYRQDGTVESLCLIELWDGQELTPDMILAFHKMSPDAWTVVSYTNNVWHAMMGKANGNRQKQMYQSKLVAKPKLGGVTFADVDAYFSKKEHAEIKPLAERSYSSEGEVLEICLPDLHMGLLAWAMETGEDYDLHIAKHSFMDCMADIAGRCKGRVFSKILFVTLGDLLHIDNDEQQTTKGTFQQADGRMSKIFDFALDMLIAGMDILLKIAPVEVTYTSGNHDRLNGYTLIKSLEMAYRHDSSITFDVSPDPQKYKLVGRSLIGWTHGDMPRKNMGDWLVDRGRAEFGRSEYAEVHSGHIHHESVWQDGAVTVKSIPPVSPASWWEHQQGYPKGTKTMLCYVWHPTRGLREVWYSNI